MCWTPNKRNTQTMLLEFCEINVVWINKPKKYPQNRHVTLFAESKDSESHGKKKGGKSLKWLAYWYQRIDYCWWIIFIIAGLSKWRFLQHERRPEENLTLSTNQHSWPSLLTYVTHAVRVVKNVACLSLVSIWSLVVAGTTSGRCEIVWYQ
jgi:hypothetical protein